MIAIPASLLATFIVMQRARLHARHRVADGPLADIGILVDDSIVVLENITRHRDMGEAPIDAAITGRGEIGGAAVAITLVDVVVFLPIAFLSGIVGKYMSEFGIVVVVATLFSLLVSFTLTPMLAARWSVMKRSTAPPRIWPGFQRGFERLDALVSRPCRCPARSGTAGMTALGCFRAWSFGDRACSPLGAGPVGVRPGLADRRHRR